MWHTHIQKVPSGLRYRILAEGKQIAFRELFGRLESDVTFADWYTDTLAGAPLAAYFWEHPPLTEQALDQLAEFVLIESTSLARRHPDPQPFEDQFARHRNAKVITFSNLGGDALLVVPTPMAPYQVYLHLAAFLRGAPKQQVQALWMATAKAVRQSVGTTPKWLSTAGLGVSWLHLRLDSRPKYYRFAPYRAAA